MEELLLRGCHGGGWLLEGCRSLVGRAGGPSREWAAASAGRWGGRGVGRPGGPALYYSIYSVHLHVCPGSGRGGGAPRGVHWGRRAAGGSPPGPVLTVRAARVGACSQRGRRVCNAPAEEWDSLRSPTYPIDYPSDGGPRFRRPGVLPCRGQVRGGGPANCCNAEEWDGLRRPTYPSDGGALPR